MRMLIAAVLLLAGPLLLWPVSRKALADKPQMLAAKVCLKDFCLRADIADTPDARERGLMFRSRLTDKQAMLFVFPADGRHGFWMKNMRFPVDIIWLDSLRRVVFIADSVRPCTEVDCPVYTPAEPARFVLETAAGFCRRRRINLGDTVRIEQ